MIKLCILGKYKMLKFVKYDINVDEIRVCIFVLFDLKFKIR